MGTVSNIADGASRDAATRKPASEAALGSEEAPLGASALGASAAATARTRHIAAGSRRARRAQTASKPSVNETGGGDPSRSDPSAASGPAPPSTRAASAASRSNSAASRRVVRSRTETRYPASSFEASVEASTLRRASGASSGAIASRTISAVGGASSPCAKSRVASVPARRNDAAAVDRTPPGGSSPGPAVDAAGDRVSSRRRRARARARFGVMRNAGACACEPTCTASPIGVGSHSTVRAAGKRKGPSVPPSAVEARSGGAVAGSRSRGRNWSERTYRRASPGGSSAGGRAGAGAGAGAGDGVGKYAEDARASGGSSSRAIALGAGWAYGEGAPAPIPAPWRYVRDAIANTARASATSPRDRRVEEEARAKLDRFKDTVSRQGNRRTRRHGAQLSTRAIEPSGVPDSRNRPSFQRHARDATCPRLPTRRCG